ncbi:hypothetical protein KSC_037350 [Ktedonobacter sp. SOSP1-52]|uniref:hypothetical protein n=1 Tax=Ktedonobacter sp. SOSP1-52 TaxID=2778366 RepID=UPI0019154C6B|nr:hypothetical protein [Ktedonobacter sp. SOSP1-52]GHO64843.1 hypothetical protein KSC_037350 [Ktedonobacter sp. SOSP1-52]
MAFGSDEERKAYYRAYNKIWYQKHKKKIAEDRKRSRIKLNEWYRQYKSTLCCIRCGESHPACLHFHHRNPAEKEFAIQDIIRRSYISAERLEKEIAKCDVLCGNCHAILHWNESHDFDDWREFYARGKEGGKGTTDAT